MQDLMMHVEVHTTVDEKSDVVIVVKLIETVLNLEVTRSYENYVNMVDENDQDFIVIHTDVDMQVMN